MDEGELTPLDLLEEIRAAIDGVESQLLGRAVDIEMSRLRVLADPVELRRSLGELIGSAAERAKPDDSLTVHVARAGKSARVEVHAEPAHGAALHDAVVGSITLALAPGSSSSADA